MGVVVAVVVAGSLASLHGRMSFEVAALQLFYLAIAPEIPTATATAS